MSSTLILNGKEYYSLKNACAVAGCSQQSMRTLCVAGTVGSVWYDRALFVEKQSLQTVMGKGDLDRFATKIADHEEMWSSNMNRHFFALGISSVLIAAVLSFPLLFLDDFGSRVDIAAVPSTYNNLSVITQADSGVANAISSVNTGISDAIVDVLWNGYEFVRSVFVK